MRAFLALVIGEPARSRVTSLLDRLRAEVSGVAWSSDPEPHVTLHFLGELPAASVPALVAGVRAAVADSGAFELRLGGGGAFPSWRRPRAVWLGLESGEDRITELWGRTGLALSDAGLPFDQRRYRPHCTMGRPREPWPPAARRRCRTLLEEAAMPACRAGEVVLYESMPGSGGYRHLPLQRFPLSGS